MRYEQLQGRGRLSARAARLATSFGALGIVAAVAGLVVIKLYEWSFIPETAAVFALFVLVAAMFAIGLVGSLEAINIRRSLPALQLDTVQMGQAAKVLASMNQAPPLARWGLTVSDSPTPSEVTTHYQFRAGERGRLEVEWALVAHRFNDDERWSRSHDVANCLAFAARLDDSALRDAEWLARVGPSGVLRLLANRGRRAPELARVYRAASQLDLGGSGTVLHFLLSAHRSEIEEFVSEAESGLLAVDSDDTERLALITDFVLAEPESPSADVGAVRDVRTAAAIAALAGPIEYISNAATGDPPEPKPPFVLLRGSIEPNAPTRASQGVTTDLFGVASLKACA
ncbi:MAG: hypothetical protein WC054_05875 [Candidatus Nanopelagicales bacterium]